ncbi:phytochrome [Bradyrhizobium sp. SSBR45G]|uniref:GAF domain-containing protein n=1 Tax=unclassified Bradyrhizobium TaxID=2631580 RepID=UPI0023429EF3|nr:MULTISPECIES: GAF domain-containing protein [unclassified Bradyrhizobium]GLH81743.1 phytochrome [Bradyrhizobium sp. SSBR45G]GLH89137.1 phytochrome [Bradyrhizobium sp. SSBR45R]
MPVPLTTPAFGHATLTNCEREQIHLAGSIQPHGVLLAIKEPDNVVIQASVNAAAFLGTNAVVGRPLRDLGGDLPFQILPHLAGPLHLKPMTLRCTAGSPPRRVDCTIHRPSNGGLTVELEPATQTTNIAPALDGAFHHITSASSLLGLSDETATIFKEITGYDRVMVYRFDEEGHGEVLSERRRPDLEAFLGNRYPASDIPQIARRLYERNRVRLLVDVNYTPVPLQPRISPLNGRDLDMSLSCLRSMSPIHQKYLQNMGVGATLVCSLMVSGKLWGLIACHHYEPRFLPFDIRAACEALAETCAIRIAALESFAQSHSELVVRRLEQRLVEAVSRDGEWQTALFDGAQSLLQPLGASGAALLFEGQVTTAGDVPSTQRIRDLAAWLDRSRKTAGSGPQGLTATTSLTLDEPGFMDLRASASGLIAAPLSASDGEYLLWFRPEQVRTVTWGGDPLKAVIIGDDPSDLSPRRSFAQWHQVVEGKSEPWSVAELASARLISETVADVALQLRSVRMVIAQDQLATISGQVLRSEQPVIIADVEGRILLLNEAFEQQLRTTHPHIPHLRDLGSYFAAPAEFRASLDDLMRNKRSWRGELMLAGGTSPPRPLMVRADPVIAPQDRVLGFVLIFSDLAERKAAEAARARFQEEIDGKRRPSLRLDQSASLIYKELAASTVENAQLAALEVTHGAQAGSMPEMLESIRNSTARTLEIIEHLVWYRSQSEE